MSTTFQRKRLRLRGPQGAELRLIPESGSRGGLPRGADMESQAVLDRCSGSQQLGWELDRGVHVSPQDPPPS